MRKLYIDIETYSSIDLRKSGVYAYAEAPDFTILLIAYAFDNEPIQILDLDCDEPFPDKIKQSLQDKNIIKVAHNANFERVCLSSYLNIPMPPDQWCCTAVMAAYNGLPHSLDGAAKALVLDYKKLEAGKALINYFCKPCKPTKANHGRTRNLPGHDKEKWKLFKEYCKQDVEVERELERKLRPIPEQEQYLWELDQIILDSGVCIDAELVDKAVAMETEYKNKLLLESAAISGLENPNSIVQLKDWIYETEGITVERLNKETVPELLAQSDTKELRRVLIIRQETSKTSVKKYEAMQRMLCHDGRIRGFLQFYGASTGRWAGRLVQVQNLPRNKIDDLELARELVKHSDYEAVKMLYGKVSDILSQLIRTAFIPSENCRFIVSDFSAIEARVIAWLANEKWRLEVFRSHGKIYEASASQMFKVPIEQITKSSPLRQKGKIAELACGYGGGVGALKAMGAESMGLEEHELQGLIDQWRQANPNIVRLWYTVEEAAKRAVSGIPQSVHRGVKLYYRNNSLIITLPSGRELIYYQARIEPMAKFGREGLAYIGADQVNKKWHKIYTYGGKLVENITQAIARDCLAAALIRLHKAGYRIAFHVHDEVVLDVTKGTGSIEQINEIMSTPLPWAPDLPLEADSFETEFYKKD